MGSVENTKVVTGDDMMMYLQNAGKLAKVYIGMRFGDLRMTDQAAIAEAYKQALNPPPTGSPVPAQASTEQVKKSTK